MAKQKLTVFLSPKLFVDSSRITLTKGIFAMDKKSSCSHLNIALCKEIILNPKIDINAIMRTALRCNEGHRRLHCNYFANYFKKGNKNFQKNWFCASIIHTM
jgi:hypothetical protein